VGSLTDIHENKEAEQLLEEKVRIRTAELEKSYKLLQSKEEALRQTLAERDTLFREVHHRVKNNLQVISSLLRMHGNALSNQPVAVTALEEARRRVLSMAMIHERLYAHQHMDRIDFGEYTETLVRELMRSFALPDKKVESRIKTEQVELDVEQAIPCGLVLNELVTNALKYAFKERLSGLITVTLEQTGDNEIILAVADDGVGLPEGFNWKKSKSMGFPIVDILARQLDGTMTVESRAGLKVTIQFPRRALLERAA
jgi:two-component sensor histidine kinase